MKKVNFIPKTDIDEYLNDDFNKEIFFNLTESEDGKGIFEPLEFLNLLYEQVEIIKANKEKHSAVVKHLLGLELDKTKLYYLLLCLEVRVIKASNTAYEDNETYFKLNTCVDFIKREREKLEAKLHTIPDGFENNLEEYLKELDLFQKNEPEKYENFKEIFDSIKNTSLSKFIEYIEFLFEKSKRDYSGLTVSVARKEIFIREQLEIYTQANHRFQNFNDYANNTFNKYQPIFTEALEYWKAELDNLKPSVTALPPQQTEEPKPEQETIRYTAKHYVLAYLIECNAKGKSFPIGQKKELEKIGNEKMGAGKGNRFYKVFNEVVSKDLNVEKNLFEIGGEYWRKAVIELSNTPELVENYLQSKQL